MNALDKVCKCPKDGHSEGFGVGGVRVGERKEGERGREDSKWEIHRVSHGNMRKSVTSVQQRRKCTSVREMFGWGASGLGRQI